ncbi:MAG TPA: GlsB/YeaQ/YmgE family stress response membrane protein [Candidatus Limnocylindrales bacterium]|nr:GlsB/YeaQ/YmgE family stress response membrane protein [Candidatus Limnocylindrales bacterium]
MDIGSILAFIIIGLIAGAIARFLVPGPDPMGWIATIVLGIIGSFVGGFLANLIFGGVAAISPAGIVGSIIGAIIVLLIWRQVGGRRAVT